VVEKSTIYSTLKIDPPGEARWIADRSTPRIDRRDAHNKWPVVGFTKIQTEHLGRHGMGDFLRADEFNVTICQKTTPAKPRREPAQRVRLAPKTL
jgi:hypothetical protein